MTLHPITSSALAPFSHGFFTRAGGVSTGIYAGLNCGAGSRDAAENVTENRQRVAAFLDVTADNLVSVHQTHSADVLTAIGATGSPKPKLDAMVTRTPGVALGVLSADCQPVLFADQTAGVVGAAHAGWKGALGGVLENTVTAMIKLGARAENIAAVIGPCISQAAYEVGPEFKQTFLDIDADYARFFADGENDRSMFNLPGFGLHRLKTAGVGHAAWTGHCTYTDPSRFYSYRNNTHAGEADYGRLISAIRV